MVTQVEVTKAPQQPQGTGQYLRKVSLVVAGPGGTTLDLSQLRIKFETTQSDTVTPNHAVIRIFNLSTPTAQQVQNEFTQVTLQAGYQNGAFGVVFQGTIKQVRRGREQDQVDTYLDILAADGDEAYNQGFVSKALAAGAKLLDVIDTAVDAMGIPKGYTPDLPPNALSRGKVMYGMSRDYLTEACDSAGCTWSIQNGQVQIVPLKGYVPGTAVALNSNTGMVGLPEQTEDGIKVRCLLNPNIKIGSLIQLNDSSIQRALIGGQELNTPGRLENLPGLLPAISADGFYRIYVAECEGDTHAQEWYSNLTCLAIDRSAPADDAVSAND